MDRPQNILITGTTGYIGGSILADFLSRTNGPIPGAKIHAVVRSEKQADMLSKLEAKILNFELSDKAAVAAAVEENQIDIIVHAANSIDHSLVENLVEALGRRKAVAKSPVYMIHSSVTTLYSEEAGWPHGSLKDTDAIYEKEKELNIPHPVLQTNLLLVEKAKEWGVTSFNLVIPNVYGVGTGEGRKVSILIPALIQASIALKKVHKFDKDGYPPAAHISDIVALYGLVVERILQKQAMPSGKDGYYFAQAHRAPWWAFMDAVAKALHARGLVADSRLETWPSDEAAAEALHFPALFIRAMGTASGGLEPVNADRLGWQPKWDEQRFLAHADDEVQAVLDLDKIRSSLFDKAMTNTTK